MTNIIISIAEYRELIEAAQNMSVGSIITACLFIVCFTMFLLFKL